MIGETKLHALRWIQVLWLLHSECSHDGFYEKWGSWLSVHVRNLIGGWKLYLGEMGTLNVEMAIWRTHTHPHTQTVASRWTWMKAHVRRFPIRCEMLNEKKICELFLQRRRLSYHVKYPIMVKIHQQSNHTKVHQTYCLWKNIPRYRLMDHY